MELAENSRAFPVEKPEQEAQQRHRWVADFLRCLRVLPPTAASPGLRTRARARVQLLSASAMLRCGQPPQET